MNLPEARPDVGPNVRHLPRAEPAPAAYGPFVPLLLGAVALVAWFAVQTGLLLQEQAALRASHGAQQQTVDNAARLRQSLDAVAADTQRLADAGNPNARLLVDELRRRGITINPAAAPAAAAPATK